MHISGLCASFRYFPDPSNKAARIGEAAVFVSQLHNEFYFMKTKFHFMTECLRIVFAVLSLVITIPNGSQVFLNTALFNKCRFIGHNLIFVLFCFWR